MKTVFTLVSLLWLMTGCAHREYYNVHNHHKVSIETDKARCSYLAESRVPLRQALVTVNINAKMDAKERKRLKSKEYQAKQQEKWDRDQRIRRLRDLCLKAKGWRWHMVE